LAKKNSIPWEKRRSFDYDEWRADVRIFRASGNKTKDLECYDVLDETGSYNLSSEELFKK
jgi:hypothetical protein